MAPGAPCAFAAQVSNTAAKTVDASSSSRLVGLLPSAASIVSISRTCCALDAVPSKLAAEAMSRTQRGPTISLGSDTQKLRRSVCA